MKTTTHCLCELCIRYGTYTELDKDNCLYRTFEVENRKDVAEFPVCDCCAAMLDEDTRKPEDR